MMSDHSHSRRRLLAVCSAVVLALAVVTPVAAYQEEGGYKNCGEFIAYTHARFNTDGLTQGPGETTYVSWDYAAGSGWHVQDNNGLYSGNWMARGIEYLDFGVTAALCRNYG